MSHRKRKGLLFIIIPALCFALSLFLIYTLIRNGSMNDLERFSVKIKKQKLPINLLDSENKEKCYKPDRVNNRLSKLIKKIDSDSCRRTILNVACLLEKKKLYPEIFQSQCNRKAKPVIMPKKFMVSIGFVILVRSRHIRQIKRLLLNIFRPEHTYFIYVASCSNYTFSQLTSEIGGSWKNIFIKQYKLTTSNGVCQKIDDFDLTMAALSEFLTNQPDNHWNWDYLIKLNENDFPILSVDDIARFFAITIGTNYLDSANYLPRKTDVVAKCNGLSYHIGDSEVPKGILIKRGPFWFAFTKDFVKYFLHSVNEPLAESILKWAKYTGGPGEFYFHTLLANSIFCTTLDNRPLFVRKTLLSGGVTNFDDKDFFQLNPEDNLLKLQLFGENFDPMENQQIIENIESLIQIPPISTFRGMKNYWFTLWNRTEGPLGPTDGTFVLLTSSIITDRLKRCQNVDFKSLTPLILTSFRRFDTFEGVLLSFTMDCGTGNPVMLEAFVQYVHHQMVPPPFEGYRVDKELLSLQVIASKSHSELRKVGNVFGSKDKVTLITEWVVGDEKVEVNFVFMDPEGLVRALRKVNVSKLETKVTFNPNIQEDLQPGYWTVQLIKNLKVIGETNFLVLPSELNQDDNASRLEFKRYKSLVSAFYKIKRLCARSSVSTDLLSCHCSNPELPVCEETEWSSYSPDDKSDISRLNDHYVKLV